MFECTKNRNLVKNKKLIEKIIIIMIIIYVFQKNNNKTLQDCTLKFSNLHLTFVAICIPIVFHGTLENFIINVRNSHISLA
jgi:hypothetical protein